MDYSEVFGNIARTTRIMGEVFTQTQDMIKEINRSISSAYNAIAPVLSSISHVNMFINETVQQISKTVSPILSTVRELMSQFNIQSLLSQLRDVYSVTQCLSDANRVVDGHSSGTVFESNVNSVDETVCEKIIADGLIVSERVIQDDKLKPIQRKSILKKFFKIIKNLFTSAILPLLFFIMAPYWQSVYDERIAPTIYYNEFIDLQEQNPELNLRIVVKNTALYLGKHMKVVTAYVEKYDIVEVLEDRGKIIKVRIYDSDEIGWIYKKYTNGSKKHS